MTPVLARTRTSQLLHPQNPGFVVSALWQRLLVWFPRAKIPARQLFPWKDRREKEELGLLSFPCLWQAGECQGSRAGTGNSVPHGRWAKEAQPRWSCGARLCSSPLPAFHLQALVLGNSSARALWGGHCQGQAVQEEAALSLGLGEGSGDRNLGVKWFPVTLFPFIPESRRGGKHNNQNLKSMSEGLDASGRVPFGRGWNCVFLLIFGPWLQIPNTKTHPAPSFELITPSGELPECPLRQG